MLTKATFIWSKNSNIIKNTTDYNLK